MTARLTTPLDRRRALKALGAAALAALPAGRLAGEAAAGRTWCRVDPLLRVGDVLVDVALGSEAAMLTAATGPIKLVVTVPDGLPVTLVYDDGGFGFGYDLSFAASRRLKATSKTVEVRIDAYAPASDGTLPVEVYATTVGGKALIATVVATGSANTWITTTNI